MGFKLYLWICIHCIHCLVFRLSLCHWFHHLVSLIWWRSLIAVASPLTASRGHNVWERAEQNLHGLAPAAPCRWHALLPCTSRPLIPTSVSARRTDSLNWMLHCRVTFAAHKGSRFKGEDEEYRSPWGWIVPRSSMGVDEWINSQFTVCKIRLDAPTHPPFLLILLWFWTEITHIPSFTQSKFSLTESLP